MFTIEQIQKLAPFEDNFKRAVNARWTMPITAANLRIIYDEYVVATGSNIPFNAHCGACIVDLLNRAGRLYFESQRTPNVPTESTKRSGTPTRSTAARRATKSK